jgi:dTDP-4-dehydrorhamnose reductase
VDLSLPHTIEILFREAVFDALVNCAGFTRVDACEEPAKFSMAMTVNGTAPGWMAKFCKKTGRSLVHFSTDYVFDGSQRRPYTELDEPKPLNVYGKTKLDGDNAVTGSGCRHLVLRTSWVYGPRGRNFFLTILRKAGTGETLRVVDDQIGAPTSSLAIANAGPSAISRAVGDPSLDGIYHLSAGESTTWCGFACAIVEASGMRVPVHAITSGEFAAAARRPRNSLLNNAKIARQLGIRLPSWRTGMAEVLAALGPGLTAIKN